MKVLAIIPARGGSKGVPHKNIIPICGKPLIVYTIEPALEALKLGVIDKLIVSTDDEEIAEVSKNAGADVPFMRPDYLSNDTAKSVDVMIHAADFYKEQGIDYDTILLLQPTAPLRSVDDIVESLNLFDKEGTTSLISCYKEEYVSDAVTYYKEGNLAIALNPNHNKGIRRQEEKEKFVRNGAIYITTVQQLNDNHRVFDDVPAMYVMPKERSVNIDTLDDVELLEWRLTR